VDQKKYIKTNKEQKISFSSQKKKSINNIKDKLFFLQQIHSYEIIFYYYKKINKSSKEFLLLLLKVCFSL